MVDSVAGGFVPIAIEVVKEKATEKEVVVLARAADHFFRRSGAAMALESDRADHHRTQSDAKVRLPKIDEQLKQAVARGADDAEVSRKTATAAVASLCYACRLMPASPLVV